MSAPYTVRIAVPSDAPECVRLRALTRENAITAVHLASLGITAESWGNSVATGEMVGWVAISEGSLFGYCFGVCATGEVAVLALLPEFEGKGIGRHLLQLVADHLASLGHEVLHLACAAEPSVRSHGFYRHLGWQGTGKIDAHGDEVLVLPGRQRPGGACGGWTPQSRPFFSTARGGSMPDATTVYTALHKILAPYAAKLETKRDDGLELYVDTQHIQKNKKPLFFGAVQVKKSSVSFHLMPVYLAPELLASVSPALKARMQGKSCFNFSNVEPALFKELAALTQAGYASYQAQGFVP